MINRFPWGSYHKNRTGNEVVSESDRGSDFALALWERSDTRTYDSNYAVTDIVSPALELHFSRDAMGNITGASEAGGFLYDEGSQLVSEATGATRRDYIDFAGLPVAVVDVEAATSVAFVTADALGSPRAVTSAAGTVIWSWPYSANPFGENRPSSSSGYVLNIRLPGQYADTEAGLDFNGNRHYDAAAGRYLQSDPLGPAAGPSTYGYVASNPLRYIDPLGLSGFGVNAGGSAQAGVINGGAMQANAGAGVFLGKGLNAGGYTAKGSFAGDGNFDYHALADRAASKTQMADIRPWRLERQLVSVPVSSTRMQTTPNSSQAPLTLLP